MSEMLGNRYFLARQFEKAIPHLEDALKKSPSADKVKKKLIICYIQSNKTDNAFKLFVELLQKDPHIISDTDPYYDDCPCGELIPTWEKVVKKDTFSAEHYMILGMLNLYCNLNKSIQYFNKANELTNNSEKYTPVINLLTKV